MALGLFSVYKSNNKCVKLWLLYHLITRIFADFWEKWKKSIFYLRSIFLIRLCQCSQMQNFWKFFSNWNPSLPLEGSTQKTISTYCTFYECSSALAWRIPRTRDSDLKITSGWKRFDFVATNVNQVAHFWFHLSEQCERFWIFCENKTSISNRANRQEAIKCISP